MPLQRLEAQLRRGSEASARGVQEGQDWFNRTVRQTEDGKASVLDLIRNAITGRGERMVWKRLKEQHPDLEQLVDVVTFRDDVGRMNKPTPVVDLEGWLQILALLPGAAGKHGQSFRQLQV